MTRTVCPDTCPDVRTDKPLSIRGLSGLLSAGSARSLTTPASEIRGGSLSSNDSDKPLTAAYHSEPAQGGPAMSGASSQTARPSPKRLLSITEAAVELGISSWTLRDLIAAGRIRAVQPPGVRRIWLDRRDIDKAIEAWKA